LNWIILYFAFVFLYFGIEEVYAFTFYLWIFDFWNNLDFDFWFWFLILHYLPADEYILNGLNFWLITWILYLLALLFWIYSFNFYFILSFYYSLVLTLLEEIYFMGDFLTQFHLENIRKHQQIHRENPSLATTILQTLAIDLSCP